jgi:hypothetical protein
MFFETSGLTRAIRCIVPEDIRYCYRRENICFDVLHCSNLDSVRFEVSTAVTMKNAVLWDTRTQFVPHRKHITSPLQGPVG